MENIRHGGWLASKCDDLNTGNANTTTSEEIQNITHYYKLYGNDAPTATIMYIAKNDGDIKYFVKATNMPHTKDIYIRKLTPYCLKDFNKTTNTADIDERGYGAILPFLYYGGNVTIQYDIQPNGSFSQIISNIDEQKLQAKTGKADTDLSRPAYQDNLNSKSRVHRFWQDEELFGKDVINMFKSNDVKTIEVFENPSFNKREKLVENKRHFQHFMEGICTQFEQLLHTNRLKIIGIYIETETETETEMMYTFYDKNTLYHNLNDSKMSMNDIKTPVTTSGRYNLDSSFTVECMYTMSSSGSIFVRYTKKDKTQHIFNWSFKGGHTYKSEICEPTFDFIPDFTVTYGNSKSASRYSESIKCLPSDEIHPLRFDSMENHANGTYVSINDVRVSLRPITTPGFPKVANMMDHSETRVFINIISKRTKDNCFHAEDWKDRSTFKIFNQPHENPIIFAELAMLSFQKKAFHKSSKLERTEEDFFKVLNNDASDSDTNERLPAVEGKNLDARLCRLWQSEFPHMDHICGDANIKKKVLGQAGGTQGNQAVDIWSDYDENAMWIAVQIKSGERDTVSDARDFINTFHGIRNKALESKKRCFGIYVHYGGEGLKNAASYRELSEEIGIFIVSRRKGELIEAFEKRIFDQVNTLIKYY
jgi:hypothetical protein